MITLPTTELIGCLSDVLPQVTDPKGSLAGVKVAWDGESLHLTTYDVLSGATVVWTPGEGAEGDLDENDEGGFEDHPWGGNDELWETWISLASAKEIVKLFTLPAKLWRFPVTIKCSLSGDRLTIERTDSPKGERLLSIPGDRGKLKDIPDVREVAAETVRTVSLPVPGRTGVRFFHQRLGTFGPVRAHGTMVMTFGVDDSAPAAVHIGSRFAGFIYPAGAKNVRAYSALRDAAGFHPGQASSGKADPAEVF